jgi:hypothetical protein
MIGILNYLDLCFDLPKVWPDNSFKFSSFNNIPGVRALKVNDVLNLVLR